MAAMPRGLNKERGRCARALTHRGALHTLTAHLFLLFEKTNGMRESGLVMVIKVCER